jgi:hypothetical protein
MSDAPGFLQSVMDTLQPKKKIAGFEQGIADAYNAAKTTVTNTATQVGHAASNFNDKANAFIEPIINRLTMTPFERDLYAEQERLRPYPNYVKDYRGRGLEIYPANTLPKDKDMPDRIPAYRADPTGKFGGKDGLETQPTKLNSFEIYAHVRALAGAKKLGVPQLSAQELTALALKEGKDNFGALWTDENNKDSMRVFSALEPKVGNSAANFAALVAEKKATAKRLGIPFAEAWNGTGHSYADKNTTGADYARNYGTHYMKAALHPKNRPLLNLIQSALDAEK